MQAREIIQKIRERKRRWINNNVVWVKPRERWVRVSHASFLKLIQVSGDVFTSTI